MRKGFLEKVPASIEINGIDIPSYQRFWEETRRIETRIDRCQKAIVILGIANIALGIALIAVK